MLEQLRGECEALRNNTDDSDALAQALLRAAAGVCGVENIGCENIHTIPCSGTHETF